jgi:putative transposase
MKVKRGYKAELDLNNEQITLAKKHCGAARWAYNYALARKKANYQQGLHTPYAPELHREINALKQTDIPWAYEVSKCAFQEALRDADDAFKHFFRKVALKKQGQWKGKCGYPRFKSKKKAIGSARFTGHIHVYADAIQLPRLGLLRLKEHEYLPMNKKIGSATISEHAGRWFVSLCVHEEQAEPIKATGEPIGVDLGIKTLATVSDGRTFANPKALRKKLNKLKRAARQHSRKHKGSKNRQKAKQRLAKMHARIANVRQDALHKATSALVAKTKPESARPRVIVLEDLNVSGMLKNHKLALACADVGLYEFRRQVEYKARFAGVEVLFASRWYPSSKTCHACQYVVETLPLSIREWACPQCGAWHDRDLNAALNLAALA